MLPLLAVDDGDLRRNYEAIEEYKAGEDDEGARPRSFSGFFLEGDN